jgi:hypothetical protein
MGLGRLSVAGASGYILACLLAQAATSFTPLGERFWPFLNYHMYRKAHYEGDAVYRYALVGIPEKGDEVPIRAEDLDLTFYKFHWGLVDAIRFNDMTELKKYVGWWERKSGRRLAALRLENHPYKIYRDGIVRAEPFVVKVVPLGAR